MGESRPRITISITAPEDQLYPDLLTLDLPSDFTLAGLKSSVEAETNLPTHSQHFFLNGQPLSGDSKTLGEVGIRDGDMVAIFINRDPPPSSMGATQNRNTARQGGQNQQTNGVGSNSRIPTADEVETLRLRLLNDPDGQTRVRELNPDLSAALYDRDRFREMFLQMKRQEDDRARERAEQLRLLNEDPFNIEAQQKIEEMIRQDNVTENLQHAIENNPEGKSASSIYISSRLTVVPRFVVFGRVTMLYINAEVNGRPVKAFVDSGAQATIMSPSCAENCNIMRLIDKRYAGVARGVGIAKILGRVHSAAIKIGDAELPCAFTVMEGKDVDLLLGLDMLKKYQACIDLQKGVLRFEGNEVPFLPESEIPKYIEDAELNEPTVAGPNGTEIGARSGAVRPAGASAAASASAASSGRPTNFKGQGQTLGSGTAAQGQPLARQSAPASFPQESINQLQNLGFSRDEAIRALEATGGNVDYAAALLFPS